MQSTQRQYDQKFYENEQDASLASARRIASFLYERLRPSSVVDVGCRVGGWLLAFRELGVPVIQGYDGDWVRPEMLRIPAECFTAHNIGEAIEPRLKYDLAISLEAAEHLPAERAAVIVESLTRLAPVVLFSAAIPNQEGRNHVNEQWPAYWIELFAAHRYKVLDCLRARFWNDPDVRWWYKQNAMLFVSSAAMETNEAVRALAEESLPQPLPLVHPDLFVEKWDKLEKARKKSEQRPPTLRTGWREFRRGLRNSLRSLMGKEPK